MRTLNPLWDIFLLARRVFLQRRIQKLNPHLSSNDTFYCMCRSNRKKEENKNHHRANLLILFKRSPNQAKVLHLCCNACFPWIWWRQCQKEGLCQPASARSRLLLVSKTPRSAWAGSEWWEDVLEAGTVVTEQDSTGSSTGPGGGRIGITVLCHILSLLTGLEALCILE